MPDYRTIAKQKARKYGLDPYIFLRQIKAESNFNPTIRSPAGATGIAQIMPGTAKSWGVNPLDPVASLDAAAKNMAKYVKAYGNYENALRAYNAGPGAIERSKGYSETNNYVAKILFNGRDPGKLGVPGSSPPRSRPSSLTASPAGTQSSPGSRSASTRTVTTVIPGTPATDNRKEVLAQYLLNRHDPSSLLNAALAVKVTPAVPEQKVTRTVTLPSGTPANPAPTKTQTPKPSTSKPASSPKTVQVKPGVPVANLKQVQGRHETAGLPGYPAHDYMAPAGSRAVSPVSGVVQRFSGHDPANGPTNGPHGPFGYSMYIKGNDGRIYYLTHMGSRTVKVGQKVKQGQVIGTVGNYAKFGGADHIHMGVHG